MAVTKLMHMKESRGSPHIHLKNAIDYVLDVKHGGAKTGYGELTGGNSGLAPEEIFSNFLETKEIFGKRNGRQGYHFVISFPPGETDAKTAYAAVQEFCEAYLADAYDYMFAVHNDREHMHGHIIFNSVSRDGYKYHYKKGDWEKYIQPVTDRICRNHGLEPLTFGQNHKAGMSYADWNAKQNGRMSWSSIMRADIDYAAGQSASFAEFAQKMQAFGYQLRTGQSKKYGTYITYKFGKPDGKKIARRSYSLGSGYGFTDILERIRSGKGSCSYEEAAAQLEKKTEGYLKSAMLRSAQTYKRLYQAASYYRLPNPYAVPPYQVRSDMMRIDALIEDCRYMKEHGIRDGEELKARCRDVSARIAQISSARKMQYRIAGMAEEPEGLMEHYHMLKEKIAEAERKGREDEIEKTEDEIEEMENRLPPRLLEAEDRIRGYGAELQELRREKRILNRILETEQAVQPEPAHKVPVK